MGPLEKKVKSGHICKQCCGGQDFDFTDGLTRLKIVGVYGHTHRDKAEDCGCIWSHTQTRLKIVGVYGHTHRQG